MCDGDGARTELLMLRWREGKKKYNFCVFQLFLLSTPQRSEDWSALRALPSRARGARAKHATDQSNFHISLPNHCLRPASPKCDCTTLSVRLSLSPLVKNQILYPFWPRFAFWSTKSRLGVNQESVNVKCSIKQIHKTCVIGESEKKSSIVTPLTNWSVDCVLFQWRFSAWFFREKSFFGIERDMLIPLIFEGFEWCSIGIIAYSFSMLELM